MERSPPLLEQRFVGHLLSEGVLESVLDLGEQTGLIEELSGLQMGEAQAECLLRDLGDGLEERQGHLCTDDGSGLQQLFLLRGQAVDACCQHRLHRGRHLDTWQCLGQTIGPLLTDQHLRFH